MGADHWEGGSHGIAKYLVAAAGGDLWEQVSSLTAGSRLGEPMHEEYSTVSILTFED